ncbi:helix-turn-helix transcriptional regulator [Spirosoma sordidisoli]|uniref:YafY family transcriptional regulator n=1 Tax=Spirosoma sordidisoli TaxID=2502893 RepID=A0A4Q2UBZ5_9BACT|nr:YafY family protein [Spirosoma sordidisoli]RYC66603.1 YafY family transcriptional regulator [Spirosoma sordidisoli]
MKKNDIKRITRMLGMLTQLQTKRLITAPELAQRFSVSVRTIYRDLRALEQAGVPMSTQEGKGYFLLDGYRLPPVQFTQEEANALITAEQLILHNKDGLLIHHFTEAIQKVKAVLQPHIRDKANLLTDRVKVYENRQRQQTSACLMTLQAALINYNLVRIAYHSLSQQQTMREVEPFALLLSSEADWLLVAWCRLRQAYRMFRVDHIEQLTALPQTFTPHTLTLQEYFKTLKN